MPVLHFPRRVWVPLVFVAVSAALAAAPLLAHDAEAHFATEKSTYLLGEPIFVSLSISNTGDSPIWIDFGPPDSFCNSFTMEVPGADLPPDQRGCGGLSSCMSGQREIAPGKSISLRQLLNREFWFSSPGAYSIQTHATILVRNEGRLDSPLADQFVISDVLPINLVTGTEAQLKAAFDPFVADLNSREFERKYDTEIAITTTAPPVLEDVLIQLANRPNVSEAMAALRKANTPKTRAALARYTADDASISTRLDAIRNLGLTGDRSYLPLLLQLMMTTDNAQIKGLAVEAVGTLGGADAVQDLAALLLNSDPQTRLAGAGALASTQAREAVPLLIGALIDPAVDIRQSAVAGLATLTHRVVFDGANRADVGNPQSAHAVQEKWRNWWQAEGAGANIYGEADCANWIPLN